jgi:amino acid transporter
MAKDKKLIKKEISALHWLFLTTSKLMIGIGIGMIFATYIWSAQPYWYLLILLGALILAITLYTLAKAEEKEEIVLKKKLKK